MLPIVKIENPGEEEHGVIYHGMNEYAAQYGMQGTGGYFFQCMMRIEISSLLFLDLIILVQQKLVDYLLLKNIEIRAMAKR